MTKKNVGGSFTFEAYNSKEYTDGISFSINQDGQYKVAHVLDNKWGKVAVLATKDDLPNIFTNKVTGTNATSDHVETIKNLWNSFPEQQVFACNVSDANNFAVFGFLYNSRKHGAILYISFSSCGIVRCTNGTFSNITL